MKFYKTLFIKMTIADFVIFVTSILHNKNFKNPSFLKEKVVSF